MSFELLDCFIKHPGKVLTIEELIDHVWTNSQVSDETVIQRITLLRKAIGDNAKSPQYIESLRGRGYRLIATPSPITEEKAPLKIKSSVRRFLVITLVILSVVASYYIFKPSPSNKQASLTQRAYYYLSIGQLPNVTRAIDLFSKQLANSPNDEKAIIGLSRALSTSVCRYNQPYAKAEQALKLIDNYLEQHPNNPDILNSLAFAWDCLGNLEKAFSHYQESLRLEPNNLETQTELAHLLGVKGYLGESLNLTNKVLQKKPDNAMLLLQKAQMLELLQYTSEAEAIYRDVFERFPDNVFVNEALPRFLYTHQRLNEAQKHLDIALTRGIKRNALYLYYSEIVWLTKGQNDAEEWLKKAADINPNQSYPRTLYQLHSQSLSRAAAQAKLDDLKQAEQWGDTWPINYIEAAIISVHILKAPDKALKYLQQAVASGYRSNEYLLMSPFLQPLKQHPEFYQLIKHIGQLRSTAREKFELSQSHTNV
nr:winged helix family transcriptional regulator [Pleionea sp. CnH1-48]